MVCGRPWDSHTWEWHHGRLVCVECLVPDLRSVAVRRDVFRALEARGLLRRLDEPEQPP